MTWQDEIKKGSRGQLRVPNYNYDSRFEDEINSAIDDIVYELASKVSEKTWRISKPIDKQLLFWL